MGDTGAATAPAAAPLRFESLSDAQVAFAFDFLPLVQNTLRQMAHASATPAAHHADAAALQAATAALTTKLAHARDLLQLLPNVDVATSEQEEEVRKLDAIIARKRALIEAFKIEEAAANAAAANAATPIKPSP